MAHSPMIKGGMEENIYYCHTDKALPTLLLTENHSKLHSIKMVSEGEEKGHLESWGGSRSEERMWI